MSEEQKPFFRALAAAIISRIAHGPLDFGLNNVPLHIETLRLKPGDRLVVQYQGHISREMAANIRAQVERQLPEGVKALVIDVQTKLAVLSPDCGSARESGRAA